MGLLACLFIGLVVGERESRPWIVWDEHWSLVEPLLPKPGPNLVEGRPDRQALCGILFVLHTGIQYITPPRGRVGMGERWQGIRGGRDGLTAVSVPPVDVESLIGVKR
ncbi:transposase [Streptomyces indiaensis]|uniref:Insertion element IS402-like domain-containing protein n=1 Tax=Streptomyces indiaensis TaxID=284033 RepID=A0ABN3DZ59_9ACTN